MKTTNTTTKARAIMETAHKLTRATVDAFGGNYRATLSITLKLYYRDFPSFLRACKLAGVSTLPLAVADNDKFDIMRAMAENDARKIDSLLNFAIVYGLKRIDARRTIKEINAGAESDNYYPQAVDSMRQNDIEDVKHDIVCYLLSRVGNEKFECKPNLFKLCLAGACACENYIQKSTRRAVREAFSLDEIGDDDGATDKTAVLADKPFDAGAYDCINFIIAKLPKAHRETAREFLPLYFDARTGKKSGLTIETISAHYVDASPRTLKSIISEIRALGVEIIRNR